MDKSLNVSDGVPVKATPCYVPDESAPAAVTNLSVSCINGSNGKVNAVLTWTDPTDDDLFGIEVTYAEKTSSRAAVEIMSKGSIFVAPQNNGVVITDLTAGKTYTFTVIEMDTRGSKSNGVTKDATMSFSQLSELKITLTPSTTEITNQDVTISVSATSSSSVSKIYYVSGIKRTVADVLKGTDIASTAAFAAPSNGTYTVAAVDYYLVSYTKAGDTVVTDDGVSEETYSATEVELGESEEVYSFSVKAVDKVGNEGKSASILVNLKYNVGDIILTDGTKVDVADVESYSIDENNKPVAVIAGFNTNGVALGLGLKKSEDMLTWALKDTSGFSTEFTDIIAEFSGSSTDGFTFTGDLDGSDNWNYICSVDPEGTKDAATNYPAFDFAENYGTTQGYSDEFASGWYIPSISELYEVYKNKPTLNKSLKKADGFEIDRSWFWSSSQSSSIVKCAIRLLFVEGTAHDDSYKEKPGVVVVLHAL